MNRTFNLLIMLALLLISSTLYAQQEALETASATFAIPKEKPDIVITANSMNIKDGIAKLEGNVRATRQGDLLTCNRALVSNSPRWLLASLTPRLFRKESIFEKKVTRELFLDARNIYWNAETGKFNASDSVNLRIEEKSWDLATYTWVIITSDAMAGYRDNKRLIFSGNVKIKDKDRFGRGQRLDYLKDTSTAVLTGNAYIETKEWNSKKGKFEKRIVTGERITYNTETKEAIAE